MSSDNPNTLEKIERAYEKRERIPKERYSFFNPSVFIPWQERERVFLHFLNKNYFKKKDISELSLLEVGCGTGANILQFIRYGFTPEKITANELLPERVKTARMILPSSVTIVLGDASQVPFENAPFDLILVSTVFSSILDHDFRKKLALRIWDLLSIDGAVLWYDFIYNNPRNPDVEGISVRELKALFSNSYITYKKVTLAPPISRFILSVAPWNWIYSCFNLPFLRTHIVAWIQKHE